MAFSMADDAHSDTTAPPPHLHRHLPSGDFCACGQALITYLTGGSMRERLQFAFQAVPTCLPVGDY